MEIKKAVIERCSKCGGYIKELKPAEYGCDFCKKRIKVSGDNNDASDIHLRATIFYHRKRGETKDLIFCSWKCLFSYLKYLTLGEKELIDFISLPVLTFDRKEDPGDFFEEIK